MRKMKLAFDVDRAGSIASSLCAIHCVLSGVAVSLLTSLGASFIASKSVENLFLLSAAIFGIWAVITGYKKHFSTLPGIIFVLGVGLLAFSHFGTHNWVLSTVGGIVLVSFHIYNHFLGTKQSTN